MKQESNKEFNDVVRTAMLILFAFAGCKYIGALFAGVLAVVGLFWAFNRKVGLALSVFMFFSVLVSLDGSLMPHYGASGIIFRMAPVAVGMALAISSGEARNSSSKAPLEMLLPYLGVVALSSLGGWHPLISFLKLAFFLAFLIGVWQGSARLGNDEKGRYVFRIFVVAFIASCILGSAISYFYPSIGFSIHSNNFYGDDEYARAMLEQAAAVGGLTLFSGIFNQPQVLGPFVAMAVAWLLLDMLLVDRRFPVFKFAICAIGIGELFMSRSRTGLLTFVVAVALIFHNAMSSWNISPALRRKLRMGASVTIAVLAIAAGVAEIRNHAISRWIYKTDNTESIQSEDLKEAVTSTRKESIERNLADYRENRLFGTGFQVSREIKESFAPNAIVFSAPIEKGLLPLMILGEAGILGFLVFGCFLAYFYHGCKSKGFVATSILFTAFLASNMGESSFFSAGGIGGIHWAISILGGLAIDKSVQAMDANERKMAMAAFRFFRRRRG